MQSKDVFLIQSCRTEGKINFLPFLRFIVLMFFLVMFKYVREWEEFIGKVSARLEFSFFFNLINSKDPISINRWSARFNPAWKMNFRGFMQIFASKQIESRLHKQIFRQQLELSYRAESSEIKIERICV